MGILERLASLLGDGPRKESVRPAAQPEPQRPSRRLDEIRSAPTYRGEAERVRRERLAAPPTGHSEEFWSE